MKRGFFSFLTLGFFGFAAAADAAFLIEVDTDGADDGVLTFSPNFSFGGDTTTASQSAASGAFGLTGGDSIFGGNGSVNPDTYIFSYDPSSDADNLALTAGTDLGDGNFASGIAGGTPGTYAVYATWPFTTNVSGGLTNFDASTTGDAFSTAIDQNAGGAGSGDEWYLVGTIDWASGPITLTQSSTSNTFVSMRSAGVLFEQIPEPATGALAAMAGALVVLRRRR